MVKKSLSVTTNEMQECPRISTMSKKDQILEKNGLNVKLKRRKVSLLTVLNLEYLVTPTGEQEISAVFWRVGIYAIPN